VKFIQYHERLKNYNEVRERIFSGIDWKSPCNTGRMRQYFRERKAQKHLVVSTIFECNIDNRRYAKLSFMNYSEIGLLDIGANVCIGSTLEKESFTNLSNYKAITSHVRTAGARLNSVSGILKVLMRYKAKEKVISSISQRLILGIDF